MTQYMLLIYANENDAPKPGTPEMKGYMDAYGAFTQGVTENGQMKAGDALTPVATATTVRVRDGKTVTSDGPFAETKEQLGGYYLIEAENLDLAIETAAKIPTAGHGSIEVRPVMVFE